MHFASWTIRNIAIFRSTGDSIYCPGMQQFWYCKRNRNSKPATVRFHLNTGELSLRNWGKLSRNLYRST
eukprot:461713-Rhodomonas_salina.1